MKPLPVEDTFPRWILYLVFMITLLAKIYVECNYMLSGGDNFEQYEMAFNFFKGKGMSISFVDKQDISHWIYQPRLLWPPGFILMVGLAYSFTSDFAMANILVDSLGVTILWFVLYNTFQLLKFKRLSQVLIFGFLGISFSPLSYLYSTDLWAMIFLHGAVYTTLRIVKNQAYTILNSLILSVLIFLVIFTKYMYYVIIIFPLSLFLFSYLVQEYQKSLRYFATFLATELIIITLSYLWFIKKYTGRAFYVKKESFEIYWEHLAWLDPFPFKSLFYTTNIQKFFIIKDWLNSNLYAIYVVIVYLTAIYLTLVLFYYVYQSFFSSKILETYTLQKLYIILFALTTSLNVAYLVALSLALPPQTGWTDFWTYVQETRYYAPSLVFIIICFVYFTLEYRRIYWLNYVNIRLGILILMFASAYMSYRVGGILLFERANYNVESLYRELWDVNAFIQPYIEQGKTVIITDHSRVLRYAEYTGAVSIRWDDIRNKPLKTSEPVTILLYFPNTEDEEKEKFRQKYEAKLARTYLDRKLYEISLQP